MTENNALPPKPSPRDLAREARRLDRGRQPESTEPRVIQLRAAPVRPTERHFDPAPDPKEAA
jgi:hypothetical protein